MGGNQRRTEARDMLARLEREHEAERERRRRAAREQADQRQEPQRPDATSSR